MIKYSIYFFLIGISFLIFAEKGLCENIEVQFADSLSFEEREEELLDSIDNFPENYGLYRELGKHYRNHEKFNEALELYAKWLKLNQDYSAYIGRGITFISLGDTIRAYADFNKAININPNDTAYFARAFYNFTTDSIYSALRDLNMSISINPKNEIAVQLRSSLYYSLEMYDSAKSDIETLKKINSLNSYVYYMQAQFGYDEENYLNALTNIDKTIELEEEPESNYLLRGKINYSLGKYADAVNDLRIYDKYQKDNIECKIILAYAYFYVNNYLSAIKYFTQVENLDKTYMEAESFYVLSSCYMSEEDTTNTIKYLKKAIASNERHSNSLNLYGLILLHQGKYEDSEFYLKEAVKYKEESDYYPFINLGILYSELEKYDEAIENYKLAKARNLELAEEYEKLIFELEALKNKK